MTWKYENFVQTLGKWAWIILFLNGLIYLLAGIIRVIVNSLNTNNLWSIIGAIFSMIFAYYIVKPKFSDKCEEKNWYFLLNYSLDIDSIQIPWMFIIAIIASIFSVIWGGLPIFICAILLVADGPKPGSRRIQAQNNRNRRPQTYNDTDRRIQSQYN